MLDSLPKVEIEVVSLTVECPSKAFLSPPYMNEEAGLVKAVSDLIIPPPPFIPCIIGMFVVVCDESMFGEEVSTLLAWVDMFTEEATFVVLSVEDPLRYALERLEGIDFRD